MTIARRSFLAGMLSACAAPAIVRGGILMPVKTIQAPRIVVHSMWLEYAGKIYPLNPTEDQLFQIGNTGEIIFIRDWCLGPDGRVRPQDMKFSCMPHQFRTTIQ